MQNQLATLFTQIDNSPASMFTKADVKALLESLSKQVADQRSGEYTPEYVIKQLDSLQEEVMDVLRNYEYESMADLYMEGREVVVDFDSSFVEEAVEQVFKQYAANLNQEA